MNQRVLDRNNSAPLGHPIEKTQEEQVQLEEILLQFIEVEGSDIKDNKIEDNQYQVIGSQLSHVQLRTASEAIQ